MGQLECQLSHDVGSDELLEFYARQKHPISASRERIEQMLARSACVVLARVDTKLVGMSRGVSDGVNGYLAECKLDPDYQGPAAVTRVDGRIEHDQHGIARAMADQVLRCLKESGVEHVYVMAYGTEVDFCEELGFKKKPALVPMHLDPKDIGTC